VYLKKTSTKECMVAIFPFLLQAENKQKNDKLGAVKARVEDLWEREEGGEEEIG
jgi:hypothetical protein